MSLEQQQRHTDPVNEMECLREAVTVFHQISYPVGGGKGIHFQSAFEVESFFDL